MQRLNQEAVRKLLPQGEPFVFVDEACIDGTTVRGTYRITGQECFMSGHFPQRPVFPASIMVEAIGQLGIVFMREYFTDRVIDPESIYMLKSEDISCRRKCIPGETLSMVMQLKRVREPIMQFSGSIHVNGALALKVSGLSLSFSTQQLD